MRADAFQKSFVIDFFFYCTHSFYHTNRVLIFLLKLYYYLYTKSILTSNKRFDNVTAVKALISFWRIFLNIFYKYFLKFYFQFQQFFFIRTICILRDFLFQKYTLFFKIHYIIVWKIVNSYPITNTNSILKRFSSHLSCKNKILENGPQGSNFFLKKNFKIGWSNFKGSKQNQKWYRHYVNAENYHLMV